MSKVIKGGGSFADREASPAAGLKRRHPARPAGGAKTEADDIVARAEAEAEAQLRAVEAELAATLEAARARGDAEGRQQVVELGARVDATCQELQAGVEHEALKVALELGPRLFQAEIESSPEAIVRIVRQAVLSSRQQREIYIRVNPCHIEVLRAHRREIVDVLGRAKDIAFREDADLAPGGCVVETELGLVDAQVSTQFDVLARVLTGGKPL